MTLIRSLAFASLVLACATAAQAQSANSAGTSTSTSAGSASTVPQFPSGGTAGASGGGASPGGSKIGAPTAVEQQEQRKSDQDTKMICKGC